MTAKHRPGAGKAHPVSRPLRRSSPPCAESRPEEVARARKLIQDPTYPNAAMLDRVARLLSRKLKTGPETPR